MDELTRSRTRMITAIISPPTKQKLNMRYIPPYVKKGIYTQTRETSAGRAWKLHGPLASMRLIKYVYSKLA